MQLDAKQLVEAIKIIAEEKNLDEEQVESIVGQALAAAYKRDYGDREMNARATINASSHEVTVFIEKEVVDSVEDDVLQISLADAKKIKKDASIGDTVEIVEKPTTFGRVAAQTAKQVIIQRLREEEREIILGEYEDKIGTVISGIVQRVEARVIRVELGKATGILPGSEQIQGESYSVGSRIKVFLKDVERTNRGPQLILSRGNEAFVEHMFRAEVPEMASGAVEIKKIAREAGVRTKLAVISTVTGVDPVGTFVGGHGTRVQAVTSEIGEREKIDIITYDDSISQFIINALIPTEVSRVVLDEEKRSAVVYVPESKLSIAIGRGGQNVRLASKLTDYELDIQKADEEGDDSSDDSAVDEATGPVIEKVSKEEKENEDMTDYNDKDVPENAKTEVIEKKPFKGKQQIENSLLDAIDKSQPS